MLAVELLTPWQEKDRHWAALADDYSKRLTKNGASLKPLSPNNVTSKNRRKNSNKRKTATAQLSTQLIALLKWTGAFRIAVTERGEQVSSPELAKRLERWVMQRDRVVLTIGSAYGLSPDVEASADWQWSLGKLVYPHQLARLIVLEQLYRAATILAGEPYHHGDDDARHS